jgi:hypothetical protein
MSVHCVVCGVVPSAVRRRSIVHEYTFSSEKKELAMDW